MLQEIDVSFLMFNHFHKITHKSTIHPCPRASIPTHIDLSGAQREKKREETKEKTANLIPNPRNPRDCAHLWKQLIPHSIETFFP